MAKHPETGGQLAGVVKVSDFPEIHADWLELQALTSSNHFASWTDHQRFLKIGGSTDATEADEPEQDKLEELINDVSAELDFRRAACGSLTDSYPFEPTPGGLRYLPKAEAGGYRFMLLLSLFGHKAGPPNSHGDRIFEDFCVSALRAYLGDTCEGLKARVFGFPRRLLPAGFAEAVDHLCLDIGEGVEHMAEPETPDQKDAGLDIVAWRGFPDRKASQLIAFGQCATGAGWFGKINDLLPRRWCQLWLRKNPLVDPVGAFFVPHRIEDDRWRRSGVYGGVLFDRCRISWLVPRLENNLSDRINNWSDYVLKNRT